MIISDSGKVGLCVAVAYITGYFIKNEHSVLIVLACIISYFAACHIAMSIVEKKDARRKKGARS